MTSGIRGEGERDWPGVREGMRERRTMKKNEGITLGKGRTIRTSRWR